ncbi:hypothetical protein SAMN05421847_0470 [Halpernia humi]|uniref:Uncharacterized protein n=1 Tax=Halpernia humi TaxID=493375 RepID=A0A1H5TGX4_9FLAO|nr:hypothetical protein [Halpernia humi]SEF62000.1 hypothetical protein SAMN05421847_0470 [Halpernia humi]
MFHQFIKLSSLQDVFQKHPFSLISTLGLTGVFSLEFFYPIISQIVLILVVQIIAFFSDLARYKFMNQKRKTSIKQKDNKIDIESTDA